MPQAVLGLDQDVHRYAFGPGEAANHGVAALPTSGQVRHASVIAVRSLPKGVVFLCRRSSWSRNVPSVSQERELMSERYGMSQLPGEEGPLQSSGRVH